MIDSREISIDEVVSQATGGRLVHLAAQTRDCDFKIIRFLIEVKHAEMDPEDLLGMTPLMYAA